VCRLIHFRQRISIRHGGKFFQGRDDGALRSLLTVLLTRHYSNRLVSSDAIFNDPSNQSMDEQEQRARNRFTRHDLLIRTTRIGMDDWNPRHARQRRKVEMSGNFIERCFVSDWRKYFSHLSRTEIELTPEAASILPSERSTHFRLTDGDDAAYGFMASDGVVRKKRGAPITSPAFIIYCHELWGDGPAGLSVFGMSGSITYGFAHLIEHRFPTELLLNNSEFVFCEISSIKPLIPANEQSDTSFTDEWSVSIHRRGRSCTVYDVNRESNLHHFWLPRSVAL